MQNNKNIENLKGKPLSHDMVDDDFFAPSEKVWTNIEKELPQKKKRSKLPFIIGSLLGLMIILFIYNLSNNGHKNSNLSSNHSESKIENNFSFVNKTESEPNISSINQQSSNIALPQNNEVVIKESTKIDNSSKVISSTNAIKSEGGENILSNRKDSKKSKKLQINYAQNSSPSNEIAANSVNFNANVNNKAPIPVEINSSNLGISSDIKSSNSNMENKVIEIEKVAEIAINTATSENNLSLKNEEIKVDLLPIISKTELMSLAQSSNTIDEKIPLIEPAKKISTTKLIGLSIVASPFAFNKPDITDPLEGTIKSSAYNREIQVSLNGNYSLTKNLFISVSPGVRYDRLQTVYDLNIPYDYNTEKEMANAKENYFSHSLPTDLGNIKTNMVVSRASNSPVVHNELIHIDFNVDYHLYSIVSPIGINYAFNSIEKGCYIGARYIPQFSLVRNAKVTKYESTHTYVSGENVGITKENNFAKYMSSVDVSLGYRLPLSKSSIIDVNASYFKNLSTIGRPFEINFGLGLYKRF